MANLGDYFRALEARGWEASRPLLVPYLTSPKPDQVRVWISGKSVRAHAGPPFQFRESRQVISDIKAISIQAFVEIVEKARKQ